MSEIKIFENEEFGKVRTTIIDNEPYFVGKDVAEILGYSNTRDALIKHIDDEDKGVAKCDTLGGTQNMTVINESGLYSLILSSKMPNAKKFKHWVTSEVLPTIRKTGGYVSNDDMFIESYLPFADDTTKALFKSTLETVRKQNELIKSQNDRIEIMKPKEDFFDTVTDSKDTIDMSQVAKTLNMGIGRNKLFEILREKKILQRNNQPYQCYVDRGFFRCIETSFTKPNGDTCINIKTVVFQKGLDFIRKELEKTL